MPEVTLVTVPEAGPLKVVEELSKPTMISGGCVNRPDGNVTVAELLAATVFAPVRTENIIGRAVPDTTFTIWFGKLAEPNLESIASPRASIAVAPLVTRSVLVGTGQPKRGVVVAI